jgi:4-hydroxy-4-methyl-2-oxoglutarate aldolase
MSDSNLERIRALDTATLSDALDRLSIVGQCAEVQARDPAFRLAARAFTVRYGPATQPAGTVGDYIDDVPAGAVIVLDNDGRTDCTVWGDILTELAHRYGIAGTVINGVCRDVSLCRELKYPIFSKGHWMRTGKDRVQVEQYGVAVNVGQARVEPGDLLVGDADGVVVIPRAHEDSVLAAAEEIGVAENRIREAVRGGLRLDEARRQFRYHQLQSKA